MAELYRLITSGGPLLKAILATFVFIIIVTLAYRRATIRYPRGLPRLGSREGISWRDMKKKFMSDCEEVFHDAYENYSKKGRAVLIPVFGPHDEVILPPSSVPWLCQQPDSVASSLAAQIDSIQLDHSLGHKFAHDPWGGWLIKTDLNSALETVCGVMNKELGAAIDATFGKDTDSWVEIDLFAACRVIVGRGTSSFTLGDSPEGQRLCQDADFVKSCYSVLDGMLDTAGKLAATQKVLRPLFGRWASRAMPAKIKDLKKRFETVYRERLKIIEQQAADKNVEVPRDLIQMMLQYAAKERPDELVSLDDIMKRLAVSNFGTMHSTVISLHNLILNVLDSDSEYDTISILREEAGKVLGSDTGARHWTRAKVAAMTRADSVARETLRVNSFIGRTVQRLVIAPEGLVTGDGIRLPQGTMVSILAHQTQTDKDRFKNPFDFDPFRFSRSREAAADASTGKPGLNHLSFVSTSADYLPFSHGRHACPGRFLVDFEFKMIMAYILANYDMEFPESYTGKRPPIFWFSGFGIPPLEAKIKVKRRT